MTDPNHESSKSSSVVPYFVLRLDDNNNKAKALFTVPQDLAVSLIHYPILCRGAAFALVLDNNDNTYLKPSNDDNDNKMMEKNIDGNNHVTTSCFLSTIYESVCPEETAQEIARRLSIRIDNTREEFQQQQNDGGGNDTSTFLYGNDILGL